MRLRTLLVGGVGVLAGAALGNRLLGYRADDLADRDPRVPGVERTYRWRGIDVSYAVAGEPDAPDLVCFHGIDAAASNDEFAAVAERLAERYRVIAVDLPGFGRSDRPQLRYSTGFYVEFVREFLADETEDPVVLASGITGAFTVEAVAELEDQSELDSRGATGIDRLVLVCPTASPVSERPWLQTLFRTPLLGTAAFNALVSKPSIEFFLAKDVYHDSDAIDEAEVAYAWHSAHQPDARHAPAALFSGALGAETDLSTELAALETPTTLIWGREAERPPLEAGRRLASAANCDLVVIDYATHFPHAEHPDEFVAFLEAELLPRDGPSEEM